MPKSTTYTPALGNTKDVFPVYDPNYWKTADALTTNKFVMYLSVGNYMPGTGTEVLAIPIMSVGQRTFSADTFERGDGVTGIVFSYNAGNRKVSEVDITAVRDPYDPNDLMLQEAVQKFIFNGTKTYGRIVKFHHAGHSPFEIIFEGLCFMSRSVGELNVAEGQMLQETYRCAVDFWYEITAPSYDDTKRIANPIPLTR